MTGFLWQLGSVLSLYFNYRTIKVETISRKMRIERPAITICDATASSRYVECFSTPEKCQSADPKIFCPEYPQYCMDYYGRTERFKPSAIPQISRKGYKPIFQVYTGTMDCDDEMCAQFDILDHLNLVELGLVADKKANFEELQNEIETIYLTTPLGEPAWCRVYGSIAGIYEEVDYITNQYDLNICRFSFPTEHLDPMQNTSIYVAIHDARRFVSPFIEGVKISAYFRNHILVTELQEQILLPYPYDTNCTDYIKSWMENNRTGPLTTLECIELCERDYLVNRNLCIPRHFVLYEKRDKLCNKGERVPKEVLDSCVDKCGPPCLERTYKYEVRPEVKLIFRS